MVVSPTCPICFKKVVFSSEYQNQESVKCDICKVENLHPHCSHSIEIHYDSDTDIEILCYNCLLKHMSESCNCIQCKS